MTGKGQRIALCFSRVYRRILSPALAAVFDKSRPPKLDRIVSDIDQEVSRIWEGQPLAA